MSWLQIVTNLKCNQVMENFTSLLSMYGWDFHIVFSNMGYNNNANELLPALSNKGSNSTL